MAGTFAEQATLATDNAFIADCRVALIKRAVEIVGGSDRQTPATLSLVHNILADSSVYAARMSWLVAAGNPTIAAAAPDVPISSDTQYAVNQMLPLWAQ